MGTVTFSIPNTVPHGLGMHFAQLARAPGGPTGREAAAANATQVHPITVSPMVAHHLLCAANTAKVMSEIIFEPGSSLHGREDIQKYT